jgi:hypothetical protein
MIGDRPVPEQTIMHGAILSFGSLKDDDAIETLAVSFPPFKEAR